MTIDKYYIGADPSCFGNIYFGDKLIISNNGSGISDELRILVEHANKHIEAQKTEGSELDITADSQGRNHRTYIRNIMPIDDYALQKARNKWIEQNQSYYISPTSQWESLDFIQKLKLYEEAKEQISDIIITAEMIVEGAKACSQWLDGRKRPFPSYDQLTESKKQLYCEQSLACLVAALKILK